LIYHSLANPSTHAVPLISINRSILIVVSVH
jgi:hypothetical protein